MKTVYARSFKDLRVYQKAREVSREAFRLSKSFPREKSGSFCGAPDGVLREEVVEYFTTGPADDRFTDD